MPVLGLTGGIASGKSTFAAFLQREVHAALFDSDRCVHRLLAEDPVTRDAIIGAFGTGILSPAGWPERALLRARVFESETDRKTLESILHPRVRAEWTELTAQARKTDAWQLVDIPLLYESGVQSEFDRVIVVAAPRTTQIRRLVQERNLALAVAEQMIASQLDLGAKLQQADHVIWNDSTVFNLDGQSRLLAAWLKRRYA